MVNYSLIDTLIIEGDKALKTVLSEGAGSHRLSPDADIKSVELSKDESAKSIGLMRVNHSGEVSAQALYQGQALTAKLASVRHAMEQAAEEENDHLHWCQTRITELGGRTSILNPFWYASSFVLGALAGKAGDKWSLGFVAETEKQVVEHLDDHLHKMSPQDLKSRAILQKMKDDELHHGTVALEAGGVDLPEPIKGVMNLVSKVMTLTSYRI